MAALFITAVAFGCWDLNRRRHGSALADIFAALLAFKPSRRVTNISLVSLVATFVAQLGTLSLQPRADPTVLAWTAQMPIPVLLGVGVPALHPSVRAVFVFLSLVFVVLETAALIVLAAGASTFEERRGRRGLLCAGAVMALAAIAAPFVSTTDVYEYVQAGWLGLRAYAPENVVLPSQFAIASAHVPVRGLIYGPLWILTNSAVTASGSTLVAKLVALRIFNAAILLGMLAGMAKARVPRPALVVCALNPAIWLYFVTDAHIDIGGVVLLVVAYACSRRKLFVVAALLVALAGLIKISFLVVGGVVLTRMRPVWRRLAVWTLTVIGSLLVSYALGGQAYLHDLLGYSSHRANVTTAANHAFIVVSYTSILALTLLGAIADRWFAGTPWLVPALSPSAFSWYLLSGIPYALASGSGMTAFMVTMPAAAAAIERVDNPGAAIYSVAALLSGVFAADGFLSWRRVIRLGQS